MIKFMRTIEFYYPNITKIVRLGTTHEGKPIEGMKIGYPISSTNKRAIWVDGNIHAREWASSHTALYFINQNDVPFTFSFLFFSFLKSLFLNASTFVFKKNDVVYLNFYVMPCLNPDGYEYTRSSPNPSVRLWRKNRSPEKCHRSLWGGEKCCKGVDLNRNFKFHWAESGSSFEPCSNIYHGDHVFSEPESRFSAVRDFLNTDELRGKVDGFITLHSYAQLWIYPYSHAQQNYPKDISELRRTARRAINRLHRQYGTEYRMGTGADVLSPASGGSDDWAKSNGIKYVYLVELRPQYELSNGFILHKKELIPTAVETFEGVKTTVPAMEATISATTSRRAPEIVFFTQTNPLTFRDPSCRDMRYSCAFWLQHNPAVCTEQKVFMKAQCAYTCKFCISAMDVADQLAKHHQLKQRQ
uniref:ShKT domain-containing protein n=1 Tax=Angiostrongylus cantonensis TaxID=6313 RepID=A0A158P8I7_ANGCA